MRKLSRWAQAAKQLAARAEHPETELFSIMEDNGQKAKERHTAEVTLNLDFNIFGRSNNVIPPILQDQDFLIEQLVFWTD